ncbi:MAG: hypothetical protein GXP55_11905, partial [Deltaproteobacteria bacterium]|nr:hypothetical protein [Deltaproteobacteria bacterium]
MPNRHASWWLAFLLAGCQSTCNPPPPMDAGMDASAPDSGADAGDDAAMTEAGIDSGMDAAVDSGMDAAVDASVDASTDAATDSGVDATIDATIDATVDAPTCPSPCRGSGECVTASCVGTACVETPVTNGTTCGELMGGVVTHLCVAGACVLRGCGDGYREPGPSPMREACDDGNASELDACSTACEPQILDLDVPPDTSYEAALGAGSLAQSGSGPLLFVWLRDRFDHAEVVARRYSPEGVARPLAEDPLVLDDMASAFDASPSVAPLPGAAGWVVVWVARRADHARVLYRILSRAGFLGAERVADDEPTNQAAEPRVAALSSGFVIAWTATRAASTDPNGGVRARVFDAMGAPTGPSFLPASDVSQREDSPTLASDADEWLLVYASSSLAPGAAPQLFARRF